MTTALMSATTVPIECNKTPSRRERFDELIAIHAKDLYRHAYWLCGNRAIAEDLVQETLLRAWRAIDSLQESAKAKGWLLQILRRENARRFERKRFAECDLPCETTLAGCTTYDTSTEAFALRRALDLLAPEYRDPLLMQVIWGYSQKEIAEHLGISVAGAGTRLFRAREKLREVL